MAAFNDLSHENSRLPKPVLTRTVLSIFFMISLALTPITDAAEDIEINYTNCIKQGDTENRTCSEFIKDYPHNRCYCVLDINIPEGFYDDNDVYFFYKLTNFNTSLYMSKDDNQLKGNLTVEPACKEFAFDGNNKPIAPCGALANSMFNDIFTLKPKGDYVNNVYMLRTGIASDEDKEMFKNPPGVLEEAFAGFAKPPAWTDPVTELDVEILSNNGFQNEDFMVWMHPESSTTIIKLYRRLHRVRDYKMGLPKGTYQLYINYNYIYDGDKYFVISQTKNHDDIMMRKYSSTDASPSTSTQETINPETTEKKIDTTSTTTVAAAKDAASKKYSTSAPYLLMSIYFFITNVLRE